MIARSALASLGLPVTRRREGSPDIVRTPSRGSGLQMPDAVRPPARLKFDHLARRDPLGNGRVGRDHSLDLLDARSAGEDHASRSGHATTRREETTGRVAALEIRAVRVDKPVDLLERLYVTERKIMNTRTSVDRVGTALGAISACAPFALTKLMSSVSGL